MLNENEIEVIWAAGVIDMTGSFTLKGKHRILCYIVRTSKNMPAARRLAKLAGVETWIDPRGACNYTIQGDKLEQLLRRVWPYLTEQRRQDVRFYSQ